MRHDDSQKRPRVDPAQNPRLAAALNRLSHGIRDAISDAPSSQPISAAAPPPSRPDDGVYVPNNDEIELLDDGPETAQRAGPSDFDGGARSFEEEMIPTSGELELVEGRGAAPEGSPSPDRVLTPSFRQGVIAYGPPAPPEPPPLSGDEVLEPSDSELELVDAPPPNRGDSGHLGGAPPPSAPYENEVGGAALSGAPYESQGDLEAAPHHLPAEPSGEPPADANAAADLPGASPWATAAAEKAIDLRDLPSSLAPIAPAKAPEKPEPAGAAAESAGRAGRSWLTIFLAIALVASVVTFLLLKFNVVAGPEGRPSADTTPIQVPSPVATQAPAPPVVPPPEPTAVAAPEPSVADAPEPSVSAIPEAPATGAPGADQAAAPSPTSTAAAPGGPAPGGSAPGLGQAPAGVKPSGPSQSGKKPSRIF